MRVVVWAVVVSSLAACGAEPAGEVPPRAVRVVAARVERTGGQARYSGTLSPKLQVDLAFRVPGRVASVKQVGTGAAARPMHEGDQVKAGEVLASLDLNDLRRQAAGAAAGAAAARAQLEASRLAHAQAEREATRARTLAKTGDLSQAELDRLEASLEAAQANRDAAIGSLDARLEQHSLTRNALTDATLRAPFDGVMARVAVDPQESVAPNVPVLSIFDGSELKLTIGLPDSRLAAVTLGQQLPVSIEALPGRVREGVVTRISPSADPVLRTYAVDVSVRDVEGLRPGMTATVRLVRAALEAAAVPLGALVRGEGQGALAVFTLAGDGRTVKKRAVEVLDLLENDALLRSGLAPGEKVVAEGASFLRDGDAVGVVP
jgi:RND family efflux transporter MFP subunit